VEAGRIREEIFQANREEGLIQALLSFEEMQPLVVTQMPIDGPLAAEPSDTIDGDADGEDEFQSRHLTEHAPSLLI
jgi:hypothetical protein